jgi:DNA-binding LacI/PurR family transcriptional regulator
MSGGVRGSDATSAPDAPEVSQLRPRRNPSITDVARIAGVSYQTVSRVINDSPDVSSTTRARVMEVIEKVGYRRNTTATALVTSKSTVIGIITDGSPRYGPTATMLALENAAREAGYGSRVVAVQEPFDETLQRAAFSLEDAGVDAIIVIAPRLSLAAAARKVQFRTPVELIAAGASSTTGLFTYSENQELGAIMATEHLIALGHTDIAHVAGSMEWFDGRVRKRGWEKALRQAGLPKGFYVEGDWSPRWAYETGLRLVKEGVPSAIFAASDHTVLGLLRAFYENGIRVPQDVSIVGYDDIEGADYFFPPLTTVRQDFRALAHGSIEALLGALEGREVDRSPISPVLVVRESTAPAAGRGAGIGTAKRRRAPKRLSPGDTA